MKKYNILEDDDLDIEENYLEINDIMWQRFKKLSFNENNINKISIIQFRKKDKAFYNMYKEYVKITNRLKRNNILFDSFYKTHKTNIINMKKILKTQKAPK